MKAILSYLSDNPNREITAAELAKEIERERPQMAGVLGAFGRRTKNRYSQSSWPFHATEDEGLGMVVYKMDDREAAIIQKVKDPNR